jgi:hypothetical protein
LASFSAAAAFSTFADASFAAAAADFASARSAAARHAGSSVKAPKEGSLEKPSQIATKLASAGAWLGDDF